MTRRWTTIALAGAAILVVAAVVGLRAGDSRVTDSSVSDKEVQLRVEAADAGCRGGHGDQRSTWQACDLREALSADLRQRGACFARESWIDCALALGERTAVERCRAPGVAHELFVAEVSCDEARRVLADAATLTTVPVGVGRFTCVASRPEAPRTMWCGDYGVDLTDDTTPSGAIVARTRA